MRSQFAQRMREERLRSFISSIKVGMTADEVIRLAKKKSIEPTKPAEKVSENKIGFTVKWFYLGITLTLEREQNPGPYKVKEIVIEES